MGLSAAAWIAIGAACVAVVALGVSAYLFVQIRRVRANQLDRVELLEVVEQMGRLSDDQREVLMLAAVEEMRYEDIASVLSIPIGTVMSRL